MAETGKTKSGFSAEERAAMKARAKELKENKSREEAAADQAAKIAEFGPADRKLAQKLDEIISRVAPELSPKLWYGMPGWARDGKILCFFQSGEKFKTRYSTFGFNDIANLDDGEMWAASFAILDLTPAAEKKIAELVKKAVS
jgi:uncharacterized protein YdhG (YjbR/CyaY superfamily)